MSSIIVLDYGDGRQAIGPYPATPAGTALRDRHFDALVAQVAAGGGGVERVVVARVNLTPVREWDNVL